jgi:hypothetical protein
MPPGTGISPANSCTPVLMRWLRPGARCRQALRGERRDRRLDHLRDEVAEQHRDDFTGWRSTRIAVFALAVDSLICSRTRDQTAQATTELRHEDQREQPTR